MMAKIIDGKQIASELLNDIRVRVAERLSHQLRAPRLALVSVGNDPASAIYVRKKIKACEEVGIHSDYYPFDYDTQLTDLLSLIDQLNQDNEVDGILVQLPLPHHIDTNTVIDAIAPTKDVDGLHPHNQGLLWQRRPLFEPCTPKGIMKLLRSTQVDLKGLDVVMVGASTIVGRPMAAELLQVGATVTLCHSKTKQLSEKIAAADVVIVAIGKPHFIRGEWIKSGAIVIDVGINRLPDGHLVGDVEFSVAKQRANWITPVPGGVGPMTVACLLENTLLAAERLS